VRVISEPSCTRTVRQERKSIYLRCTRELPQAPAGAPVPHGAAGLHAKSGAAWAAWGRDQGPAPSETQHGYFRDRAAHPSMKTLIGCRNDGQGTGSPAASTCLAAGRRAVDESSPVLCSKNDPSLGSRRPDRLRGCSSPVPNSMTRKRRRDNLTRGDWGQGGGQGRGPDFWVHQKITRSSSSGGAPPRFAASST
jgi:hypothetical protein